MALVDGIYEMQVGTNTTLGTCFIDDPSRKIIVLEQHIAATGFPSETVYRYAMDGEDRATLSTHLIYQIEDGP